MNKFSYDKERFNFREIVKKMLKVSCLEEIHLESDFPNYDLFERKNDSSTIYHKKFYENKEELLRLYDLFIEECIRPRFNEPIVYQKIPTFRIHLPSNLAVGEWHRDKMYRDLSWAEKVKEINFYLPFTKAFGTNTIWSESQEGRKDFKPMEAEYGEAYEWDASNCLHGNKKNKTNSTRVSMDFRVILESKYIDSDYGSINTGTPFKIGGYYSQLTAKRN